MTTFDSGNGQTQTLTDFDGIELYPIFHQTYIPDLTTLDITGYNPDYTGVRVHSFIRLGTYMYSHTWVFPNVRCLCCFATVSAL